MQLSQEITDLICEIEYIIGDQCYNPNSYNGYTGEEGCSYRYPVYAFTDKSSNNLVKTRGKLNSKWSYIGSVTPELVRGMRYQFGTNHLYIGEAIYQTLDMLEKRYGLDFSLLEDEHRKENHDE